MWAISLVFFKNSFLLIVWFENSAKFKAELQPTVGAPRSSAAKAGELSEAKFRLAVIRS